MKLHIDLSPIERDHLLSLLTYNAEEGSYWGNREHYWKRHQRLVDALESPSVEQEGERSPMTPPDNPKVPDSLDIVLERVAQLTAHRAIEGKCVVCNLPWPCDTAKLPRLHVASLNTERRKNNER